MTASIRLAAALIAAWSPETALLRSPIRFCNTPCTAVVVCSMLSSSLMISSLLLPAGIRSLCNSCFNSSICWVEFDTLSAAFAISSTVGSSFDNVVFTSCKWVWILWYTWSIWDCNVVMVCCASVFALLTCATPLFNLPDALETSPLAVFKFDARVALQDIRLSIVTR